MIPCAAPGAQYGAHKSVIDAAITRVLASGVYILGEETEAFERAFAEYCGAAHAVGVGSGTDALILALKGLGIGAGDEVVTVSHTALATVAGILATGATPVMVDVDPCSYTIDPARIEAAIGAQTKAVIAVHLYGRPAELDAIASIVRRREVKLVEDCAQAAGACYRGRRVGSLGDVACFSFYPTKNLGAIGDGGMIVTQDAGLAARTRRLRQYGWDEFRQTEEPGVNSRLDSLQAAILRAKLPFLDDSNARRAAIARRYGRGLAGLPLVLPAVPPHLDHSFHLYVVACDDRDALSAHLARHGVGSAVHYPVPVHRQGGYAERVRIPSTGLPATEELVTRIMSLPIFPELADTDVDRVIAAVHDFYAGPR